MNPIKSINSSAWFRALRQQVALPLIALTAFGVAIEAQAQHYNITTNWSIGVGTADLKNDSNTRGLGYNSVSNQVLVAYRGSPGAISVLDGNTGNVIAATLPGITIAPYNVGAGDDGVIYAIPLANGVGGNNLNLYSWTNAASTQRQCYAQVSGDATSSSLIQGQRVGDSFAVTGAGVNTLILMPVNAGTTTHSSTNFLLFSTPDGQTFVPSIIGVSGLPASSSDNGPQHGLAFTGSNAFFFRPGTGTATYLISYPSNFASLPSPVIGTVIATNTTMGSGSGSDVYQLAYSPSGKLLAYVGQILSAAGSTAISLFDVSAFPTANNVGSGSTIHSNANGNYTGQVALGGQGKTNSLFFLDSNNGVFGLGLSFVAAAVSPGITTQPAGATLYTNYGPYTFSVTAVGTAPLTYIWQFNTTSNQAGATNIYISTNSSYTISNLTVAASGFYDVVITNVAGSVTSSVVQLSVSTGITTSPYVTELYSLPANNSQPYLDTGYNTRGLAYDPITSTLLLAEHSGDNIYALDALTGTNKFTLTTDLTGLPQGSLFAVGQVGVADDGVLYVCNVSSYQPGQQNANPPPDLDFSIVRFSSISDPNGSNPYTLYQAFLGDPGAFYPGNPGVSSQDRWGDSMAVRGSGANTQILLGTYETIGANQYGTGPGTNVAILTTTDGSNFTAVTVAITNVPDGFSYLGVAWGASNTFWTKSPGFDLRQIAYNLTNGTGGVIPGQDFSTSSGGISLNNLCGIGLDVTNNILAGVITSDSPNDVALFQIPSGGFAPEAYYQAFFGAYNANINGNAATTVKFPYIFSLDANNGILALQYSLPLLPVNIAITNTGSAIVGTYQTVSGHTYQVQSSPALGAAESFTSLGSSFVASSSGTAKFTNSITAGAKFYRVVAH